MQIFLLKIELRKRTISGTTVEPVYYGHLNWDQQKFPDYQGVLIFQVSL